MAYPGLTFAILVGVAIGTAIYYYFNSENYQQPHQYANNDNANLYNVIPRRNRLTSPDAPRRRRRRNSNESCTICLETISLDSALVKLDCEHEFHDKCINMWLREKKECPVCRNQVL